MFTKPYINNFKQVLQNMYETLATVYTIVQTNVQTITDIIDAQEGTSTNAERAAIVGGLKNTAYLAISVSQGWTVRFIQFHRMRVIFSSTKQMQAPMKLNLIYLKVNIRV